MASLTVRNIDDEVIASLKAQAKANHQSLEGEIRHVLAGHVSRRARGVAGFRDRTAHLKAQTVDKPQTDSVVLLREDRER